MERAIESNYPPVANDLAMRIYAARAAMADVYSDSSHQFAWVGCEIALLQIRKICELFLLRSTLAHINEGGHVLNETKWRPKDAFAQLDKINDHPLPIPIVVETDKHGPGAHHISPLSRPILFSELNLIYGKCGELLHVPTARDVSRGRQQEFDVTLISEWIEAFEKIIMAHVLMLPKRDKILLCRWSGSAAQLPELTLLNSLGESTLELESLPQYHFRT